MLSKEPDRFELLLKASENLVVKMQNHDGRIEILEKKVSRLPGDTRMQLSIKTHVTKHVSKIVGGSSSPHFKSSISRIWRDFWQAFGVTSYKDTPAGMYDEAIAWIDRWRPINIVGLEAPNE